MKETGLNAASHAERPVAWPGSAEKQREEWMVDSLKKQSPALVGLAQ